MRETPPPWSLRHALIAGFVLTAGVASAQNLPAQTVVDLQTRPGVTERYLAIAPDGKPKSAVILFTGGQGVANIPDRPGPGWARNGNFLVRSRGYFRDRGLFVAVVDAPSDYKSGLFGFRNSAEHAQDIAGVIADIRRRAGQLPVWLIGTSRGTLSAVNGAVRLQGADGANGLVLTSTVTRPGGRQSGPGGTLNVFDFDLAAIRLPTLLAFHSGDGCFVTPPADVSSLKAKLSGAPRVDVMSFSGGDAPRSDDCEALSAHGFYGIEKSTVDAIADWILGQTS